MDEAEILEFILACLPETFEGWAGLVMAGCAILSLALPAPAEDAHPLIRFGHRMMCIVGLGAGKLRTAGKLGKLGKLANLVRRKP